jgi:hypothetical protein
MPRAKPTSRFRGTDLFSRRIVITISRSGILVLLGAVVVSLATIPLTVFTVINLVITAVALATVLEARHQLQTFQYEMTERIVARLEHWDIPEDMPDLRESIEAAFEEVDPNVTTHVLRLSK